MTTRPRGRGEEGARSMHTTMHPHTFAAPPAATPTALPPHLCCAVHERLQRRHLPTLARFINKHGVKAAREALQDAPPCRAECRKDLLVGGQRGLRRGVDCRARRAKTCAAPWQSVARLASWGGEGGGVGRVLTAAREVPQDASPGGADRGGGASLGRWRGVRSAYDP
eukprot:351547-Chlamydomonas_euryale.AAC.1